jgi:3-oxoacyl-[acyl-carrier-protein] synthase-3
MKINSAFRAAILSTGRYLPESSITNLELKQFSPKMIPFIEQKTGVKARRFASSYQCTSDLGVIAAINCLEKIDFDPLELNTVILCTSSPDRIQPATATRVQDKIGAKNAFAFDINSVCSGAIFGLQVADSLIKAGSARNVLLVAAEVYSRYLNPNDFSTFPYFGDGAGAILLSSTEENEGIIQTLLRTDGSKSECIQVPAGGTMLPFKEINNEKEVYFKMMGREVYEFAVEKGSEVIKEILHEASLNKEDVSYVISHQANINILKEISVRTEVDLNKFIINLDKYGNTAAASVLIGLDELVESGNVKAGDLILLVAFGGGLSWGASLIKF